MCNKQSSPPQPNHALLSVVDLGEMQVQLQEGFQGA